MALVIPGAESVSFGGMNGTPEALEAVIMRNPRASVTLIRSLMKTHLVDTDSMTDDQVMQTVLLIRSRYSDDVGVVAATLEIFNAEWPW